MFESRGQWVGMGVACVAGMVLDLVTILWSV